MNADGIERMQEADDDSFSPAEIERVRGETEIDFASPAFSYPSTTSSLGLQQSPLVGRHSSTSTESGDIPRILQSGGFLGNSRLQTPINLTHHEALLFHHYSVHLGHWLDCSDASRKFTLRIPEMAKNSPILCHAVLCFAARHRREDEIAEAAYQRCVTLLIECLNEDSATHDEMVLSSVIMLHFADQLNGRPLAWIFAKLSV